MDGALNSSRYGGGGGGGGPDDRRFHHRGGGGGGGGGGRRRGGGGRGGGRHSNHYQSQNRHHPYNRGGGGGGPHRNRGGGGGGGGGNRFPASSDRRDMGILVQLSAMLSRVGDVTPTNDSVLPVEGSPCRPEVTLVAKNISDLAAVVANPNNLKMFFEYNNKPSGPLVRTDVDVNNYYQDNSSSYAAISSNTNNITTTTIHAKEEAGLLAHLLVSCASTLVLQTPAYAALTLALHEASRNPNQGEYAGFASRCVVYAMQCFSRDLDVLLLDSVPPKQQQQQSYQQQQQPEPNVITQVQRAEAACRLKLLLRYFCLLGRLSIIQASQDQDQSSSSSSDFFFGNDKLSVLGLFKLLVTMATRLVASSNDKTNVSSTASAAYILASLVLSNIPYLIACDIPMTWITETVLQPLESIMALYQKASPYTPGLGCTAILLKDEPCDEEEGDDDDEEEEDEEEGGTDGQQPQPVCDSLQDMWRTIQNIIKQLNESNSDVGGLGANIVASSTKLALLSDDPWNHVRISSGGDDLDQPVAFVELPLYLNVAPDCRAVPLLIQQQNDQTAIQLCQHLTLDGVIFGRLPIFGSPPSPGDEEEEEEEGMEGSPPAASQQPESLLAYQREFSWNDRCLVAEVVRDCILSYESTVSSSGIERGTAKDVAERIWSLQQAWNQESDQLAQKRGLEYAILEALLSLIIQTPVMDQGVVRQVYVSRVLLELTRLQPTAVPQALAMAVSNLFQDYMPSLAPYARDNLCRWFAFHLINTDYQWPAAYWRHWTSFVVVGDNRDAAPKANSRSQFVQRILLSLSSNVHDLQRLSQECLPPGCELSRYLLPHVVVPSSATDGSIASLEQDLQERLKTEDPDSLSEYLISGELAETVTASLGHDSGDDWRRTWWRTLAIVRSLLRPAAQEHARLKGFVEKAMEQQETNEEMALDDGDGNTQGDEDMVALLLESLARFRSVIVAALTKDAEGLVEQQSLGGSGSMSDSNIVAFGEDCLLQTVHSITYYSRTVLESVVECLLQHKVVSPMSVLRWVLSDSGKDGGGGIVERWWEIAALATRVCWAAKQAANGGSEMVGDGIGMIVDATGDDASTSVDKSQAKLLLDELGPLLQYAVQRVNTLLAKQQDGSKKKLTRSEIELIEGLKYFVLSAHSLYYHAGNESQSDADGNPSMEQQVRLEELLTQSNVSGAALASYGTQLGGGGFSTDFLASVLERM